MGPQTDGSGDHLPQDESGNTALSVTSLERYRSRAWSLAGLSATGAGALATGLVLSPARKDLPPLALSLGGLSIGLLLLAVLSTGYAMLVTRKRRKTGYRKAWQRTGGTTARESDVELQKRVLRIVHNATKVGALCAALALLCLGIMAVTALVPGSSQEEARLYVRAEAMETINKTCPKAKIPLIGRIAKDEFQSDKPWIEIQVDASNCRELDNEKFTKILIDSNSLIILEKHGE